MASIYNDVPLPASADEVWNAVRDFGALHQRLVPGFVTACVVEGNARLVTFANGAVVRETLVTCDETRRRLVYAISNERLTHYNASVQVIAVTSSSCRLVWVIDMLPNELSDHVQAQTRDAAKAMRMAFPSHTAGSSA